MPKLRVVIRKSDYDGFFLMFPTLGHHSRPGIIECWSQREGHSACDYFHMMKNTEAVTEQETREALGIYAGLSPEDSPGDYQPVKFAKYNTLLKSYYQAWER